MTTCFGKELFIWFTVPDFRKSLSVCACVRLFLLDLGCDVRFDYSSS